MRELSVSFTGDGKAVLGDALSYQDEHCAVRLAVTLSEDLTSVEPDEYYLSFVRDADADNPMTQKITVGPVQDLHEGVLYFELPSFLTATTCLAVQLEAVKKDATGEVAAAVKSPPFLIPLQPSLQGEEALPMTWDANGLLERLLDAEAQTVRLNQTLTAALDQGLFLAKINGHNAVTLQGGRNLILTDDSGAITIDCSSLPIVTALPTDPQPGETVLLIPQNTVTLRESGRELTTSGELLQAAAVSEWQELLRQPASRCPFYFNLRRAGELVGFLSVTSDWEEGDMGQQNAVSVFSMITGWRGNQATDGFEATYINGVLCPDRSTRFLRGTMTELRTVPSSVRLPAYDTVEIVEQGTISAPVFFGPTALMAYCGQWLEITSLAADRHHHDNPATLDGFFCDAAEAEASAPAGQPGLSLDYTGWDRLRWGGSEVRMADDGGVISRVETVTNSGKSFLRLWLYYGEVQTVTFDTGSRTDYIDIPIDSVADTSVSQGELTLNGTELDLGMDALASDSHTHRNKATLDQLAFASVGGTSLLTYDNRLAGLPPIRNENDPFTGAIVPHVLYRFGNALSNPITSLTVTGLSTSNAHAGLAAEYLLEFVTGATAPTVTLPASVEWANEPTFEPNKHYQISILNNVALWCAVDVEEEEP